jgi:hypothetical protein
MDAGEHIDLDGMPSCVEPQVQQITKERLAP